MPIGGKTPYQKLTTLQTRHSDMDPEVSTESSSNSNDSNRTIRPPPFPGRSDPYERTLAERQYSSNDSDRTIYVPEDSTSLSVFNRGPVPIRRPCRVFDHEQDDRTSLQEQFMQSHNHNDYRGPVATRFVIHGHYQHLEQTFVGPDGRNLKITVTHGEPPSFIRGMLQACALLSCVCCALAADQCCAALMHCCPSVRLRDAESHEE